MEGEEVPGVGGTDGGKGEQRWGRKTSHTVDPERLPFLMGIVQWLPLIDARIARQVRMCPTYSPAPMHMVQEFGQLVYLFQMIAQGAKRDTEPRTL